ncbi:MAG: serine/threonine protein kinase, partial [Planctomycetota bacterium]
MPITTGQEYLSLLEKSQLLDTAVLTTLAPQVEKHSQTDPKRLAMTLIKNQLITEYQARQLMSGRYKGFYLARYKLMELLGMGGMGRVYLAEQVSMERLVAIKLISLTRNKDRQKQALARFAREALAVAALRHPNIIQAFDFVNENGMPYIVMEYVEGMDTARLVHKFGPIPWKQAAEYARQTALGLAHAHAAGIVHRDIKPGNLLVDSS